MVFLRSLIFLLETVKYFLIGNTFFEIKIKRYWFMLVTYFIFIGIAVLAHIESIGYSFLTVSLVIVNSMFMWDLRIIKKITNIIKILFLVICIEAIAQNLLKLFFGKEFVNLTIDYLFANNLISIFAVLLIWFIRKNFMIRYDGFIKFMVYLCAIIMGFSTILGIIAMEDNIESYEGIRYVVSNIRIIMCYLSMMVIVLFLFYVNDVNRKMKAYLETERLLKETQKNYYEAMLEKEKSTRKFRHDMTNHLIYVENLIIRDEKTDAINYIEDIQDGMKKTQQKCYAVGNPVIDAMLNHYVQFLNDDVSVQVFGYCNREFNISQMELCTVISNLIKNAVESLNQQKEREKFLEVQLNSGNENTKIEIINSIGENNIKIKKNGKELPETSKIDKRNHGIGLRNVKETVEKNHGIFQWELEEGSFKVRVILPCKKMEMEEKM